MKINFNNINILCKLYGKEFDSISKSKCTGDWKGTTDYSIKFKDESTKFISNGMNLFNDTLQKEIDGLNYFSQNKEALKEQVSKSLELNVDNFDLVIHNNFLSMGWICIRFEEQNYTETSFSLFCKGRMTWNADKKRTITEDFYLQK